MKLTRDVIEALPDLISLLPQDGQWTVYTIRCRDESLYIGVSQHLPWRLYKMTQGTGSEAVRRAGGPSRLLRFTCAPTEKAASDIAAQWEEMARKKREVLVKEVNAEANRETAVRNALGIPITDF